MKENNFNYQLQLMQMEKQMTNSASCCSQAFKKKSSTYTAIIKYRLHFPDGRMPLKLFYK